MVEPLPRQLQEKGGDTLRVAGALFIVSFVLAALYLARAVLEPLAIAVLLAFVLTPPIRRLRSWHFGRVVSVIAVVGLALGFIGAFVFVMETEIAHLAGEIPRYQENLRGKVASLNRELASSGSLSRATSTLNSLASELKNKSGTAIGAPAERASPVPVLVETQSGPLDYIQNMLSPLVAPLTMGGLLILFLVFILFYREDLRDRLLKLGGTRDLQRTTEAMNDAGTRLSRYFLIQAAINGCFGIVIGAGLWAIGLPNSVLWGMLAAVLRFVPYLGTPIAAIFPLALAAAIDPGWTKFLLTAALFVTAELATGQAIEPVLQGQQTGLSPVAIVVSQLFWTLIWGIPGLLLAVPVTVCIAVLGRHVEALNFLGVVLGDEPALASHEGFYQRLLAGDATEAAFQAEEKLATERLSDYYDCVPLRALALAHADSVAGKLPENRQRDLLDMIDEIVEDLDDYDDEAQPAKAAEKARAKAAKAGAEPDDRPAAGIQEPKPAVLLFAARSALDQAANLLLAHILAKRGLEPFVQPYSHQRRRDFGPDSTSPKLVCVSCFSGLEGGPLAIRYMIRRWRRTMPDARFVACFWLLDEERGKLEELRQAAEADFAAAFLKDAAAICAQQLPEPIGPLELARL